MSHRILAHLRHNTIAYLALFFAIGGGSGAAAVAATSKSTSVHACVSKKNGELFIAKKCTKATKALTLDQRGPTGPRGLPGTQGAQGAAGPAGVVATASAQVGGDGQGTTNGMTITNTGAGAFNVVITASGCSNPSRVIPVVTPVGSAPNTPAGSTPVAYVNSPTTNGVSFTVQAGTIENGSFVATAQGFDVLAQCY